MKYTKSGEVWISDNPTPEEQAIFDAEERRYEKGMILIELAELDRTIPRCLEDNKKILKFHKNVLDVIERKEKLRNKLYDMEVSI